MEHKIIATALDDHGHYGTAECSKCQKDLPEPYYKHKECPFCKAKFTGIEKRGYPFGGSDF